MHPKGGPRTFSTGTVQANHWHCMIRIKGGSTALNFQRPAGKMKLAPQCLSTQCYKDSKSSTRKVHTSVASPALLVNVDHAVKLVGAAIECAHLSCVVEGGALVASLDDAALVLDVHHALSLCIAGCQERQTAAFRMPFTKGQHQGKDPQAAHTFPVKGVIF